MIIVQDFKPIRLHEKTPVRNLRTMVDLLIHSGEQLCPKRYYIQQIEKELRRTKFGTRVEATKYCTDVTPPISLWSGFAIVQLNAFKIISFDSYPLLFEDAFLNHDRFYDHKSDERILTRQSQGSRHTGWSRVFQPVQNFLSSLSNLLHPIFQSLYRDL